MGLFETIPENASSLDKNIIKSDRLVSSLFMSVLFIASIVVYFIFDELMILAIALPAVIFLFALTWYWALKNYQYTFWWFNEEGLYIQKGVVWRKRIFVPHNRVQHTDVEQGPIARKFQLATLVVHTAGTRDASVEVVGLNFDTANSVRDKLIAKNQQDAV